MPHFQPIATYQELRRCVLNFPSAAMAPTTISAPGRFLSLPKSVASVGVDAWNKKVWAVESLSPKNPDLICTSPTILWDDNDVGGKKRVFPKAGNDWHLKGRAIYFCFFFRGRFRIFFGVPGSMLSCFSAFPASLLFLLLCFSASLHFAFLCFSCFSAFPLLYFLLSLLLCFSASLLFCFSAFPASLLFCFSAFPLLYFLLSLLLCFSCFSPFLLFAFPASLLFFFPASLLLYFCAFLLLLFYFFFSSVMCFCCSTSCSFASLLPVFTVSLSFIFFCFILFCLYPKWNPRERP